MTLGGWLRGPRGRALSPTPLPTACTRGRAALTLCRGTAIRQVSHVNSRPVQENRQLAAGDNGAFVLRLQVQGQLPVLHCRRQATWRKRPNSHHSGWLHHPQDITSASWSPPGLPVPAPSGPAVPESTTSPGPTPTCPHQHHQRTPGQPRGRPPTPVTDLKVGSLPGRSCPRAPAATQPRPASLTDPHAGAGGEIVGGTQRDLAALTQHAGQEGFCIRVTTGRYLGH